MPEFFFFFKITFKPLPRAKKKHLFNFCLRLSAERWEPPGDGSHPGHTETAEDGHAWSTAAAGPVQRVQEERQAPTAGRQMYNYWLACKQTLQKHTWSVKDGEMCVAVCRAGCFSGPGCFPRWDAGDRTDPQCSPTHRLRRRHPRSPRDRTALWSQRSRWEFF